MRRALKTFVNQLLGPTLQAAYHRSVLALDSDHLDSNCWSPHRVITRLVTVYAMLAVQASIVSAVPRPELGVRFERAQARFLDSAISSMQQGARIVLSQSERFSMPQLPCIANAKSSRESLKRISVRSLRPASYHALLSIRHRSATPPATSVRTIGNSMWMGLALPTRI